MDLDRIAVIASVDAGSQQERVNFTLQLGVLSSALEHAIPEQMFVTPENPGEAVSAVKALSKAVAGGQRLYHLTPANQASTLPNLNHDSLTLSEIQAALAVGKEVITHTDSITVPGWSGAGYIIFDPATGDGAYKISGGANGAWLLFSTFVLMGLLIVLAVIGQQYLIAVSVVFTFVALSMRIQDLAEDVSLSESDFISKSRLAIAVSWASVMSTLNPIGGNIFQQSNALGLKVLVSGLLTVFGLQVFAQ